MFQKTKLGILGLLFTASGLFAQSVNIEYRSLTETIQSDPSIKIGKLSNGLTYFIKKNKMPEKRVQFLLAVKAGALYEDDDQDGLAHFCEHMAFNGTKNFKKNELVNYLESIGVNFGGDLNAYTNQEETVYQLMVPTDNPDQLAKGMQVIEDWAHNILFENEEIDKERGVITEEWRLGKGAEDRCERKHNTKLYYNSRYALRDVIGDTAIIKRAPYENFRRFYRDWYRPNLMAVIAVGDIDVAEMEKTIKEKFSGLKNPEKERPALEYTLNNHKEVFVSVATDKELAYPSVRIIFQNEFRKRGDFNDYRMNIVAGLFSSMIGARFEEINRKPTSPFSFYATGYESDYSGKTRATTFMAISKGEKIGESLETLTTEAFRAKQHGFNATELERAKADALNNMEKALKEKDKTESSNYAYEILRHFTSDEAMPGIEAELALYKKWLPEITLEEINNFAAKNIKNENAVITVSAPERADVKVPSESEALAGFNKIASSNIPAYVDKVSDKPLFDKKLKKGSIVKENKIDAVGITEWTLSNGIKVVLKPTDFKNDEISFTSFSPGGSSQYDFNKYIASFPTSALVNQSGVGEFDQDMLEKYLSGKNAYASTSISDLTEAISGGCAPKDFETMLQIAYLRAVEPRFDQSVFEALKNQYSAQIKDSKSSPEGVFRDSVQAITYDYNPRRMPLTFKELDLVNMDAIKSVYKDRFADFSDFTFIFIGAFETEKIKDQILTYIGSLPSTNRKESWKDVGVKLKRGKIEKSVFKGIEAKSTVQLAYCGEYEWSLKNNALIYALGDILDIKLRESLREDKGGTYGAGAWARPTRYPVGQYQFNIGFGTDPKRVEELSKVALDQVKDMKENLQSEVNLNKIKEQFKRALEVDLKKNNWWRSQIYTAYFNGYSPADILKNQEITANLTLEDIKAAANKYFNDDNLAKFFLFPEKKD